MKVQARVKSLEHFPDWAKCCQEQIDHILSLPAMTLDVSRLNKEAEGVLVCQFCEAEWPSFVSALDVNEGDYMPLELADLDEGPEVRA